MASNTFIKMNIACGPGAFYGKHITIANPHRQQQQYFSVINSFSISETVLRELSFRISLETHTSASAEESIFVKINKSLWNTLALFGNWEQTPTSFPITTKHCTDAHPRTSKQLQFSDEAKKRDFSTSLSYNASVYFGACKARLWAERSITQHTPLVTGTEDTDPVDTCAAHWTSMSTGRVFLFVKSTRADGESPAVGFRTAVCMSCVFD